MMLRAFEVLAAGNWERARRRTRVALDFDRRNRRRLALTAADGLAFLLDLPKARHLRAGDGLVLESGEIVEIEAAPEPLLELSCDGAGHQVRLAWHLGNRHIPTELRPGGLRIRADHVLAEMARLLGARVTPIEAAFDPEGGAYEGVAHEGGGHHHAHHHDDDHDHPHEHDAAALGRSTWR